MIHCACLVPHLCRVDGAKSHRMVVALLNPHQNGAMVPIKTNKAFQTSQGLSAAAVTTASTSRGGSGALSAAATQVRIARRVVVAYKSMATHLLVATKSLHLSPIQASSLVALTVCGLNAKLPPPTAAAALCGTFAGMSAHSRSAGARAL
jgi:hypothetical protein